MRKVKAYETYEGDEWVKFVSETYIGSLTQLTHLDITSGGPLRLATPLALQQLGTLYSLKHLNFDAPGSSLPSGSLAWLLGLHS
jgi:hypothetical protein